VKIYINNYRNHWLSPYTILKKVCFWEKDEDVFYDHEDTGTGKYVKWVNRLDPICNALMKFLDIVHPKINYVKIDRWDTWGMDTTLAQIILPMLKQLHATKHGAPYVDDKDVPKELRSTSAPPKANEWDTDNNHFARWDWIMEELIWTFEQLDPDNDWQAQYHTGKAEFKSVACKWDENGKATLFEMKRGPNDTSKWDKKGHMKHQARITNGLKLFGKYYQGLWD
jgi:hypothetical protein